MTGIRTFRDHSGRRRFLCMQAPCTNMLKRQSDQYCRQYAFSHTNFLHFLCMIFRHVSNGTTVDDPPKKSRTNLKRHSAPPLPTSSNPLPKKNRYRSPFQTSMTAENGINGNQSDEYDIPKKVNLSFS